MNPDLREKNQNRMQTKRKAEEDSHKGDVRGIKVAEPQPLSLARGSAPQPKWAHSLFPCGP